MRGESRRAMYRSVAYHKRKLRQLKTLEIKIRFAGGPVPARRVLVWDEFFSTRDVDSPPVRYPLHAVAQMDRDERKEVFAEYFCQVYFQKYRENGLALSDMYDPQLLSLLGLPPYADLQDVKRRFRALAKRYHPDHGGDAARFIELMDAYEQLTG